jgi:hypothetical protein
MSLEINEHPQIVWYYMKQGARIGPISFDEIKQLSASGRLLPDDLVWRPGLEQWAQAREISELFTPPLFIPIANYHAVNEENANGATLSTVTATPDKSVALSSSGRKSRGWLLVLLFLCPGILACSFFYSKDSSSNLSFLIGYNLPIGLLIWGVFHAALGRKHGWKNAGLSFLAIYGSLIAGSFIGYSQQKRDAIQAFTEIQREFSTFADSATDSKGAPQRIDHRADITPTTKGEFGEIERFMKTFMNQMASQHNEYLLELNAIGWEKILDPERLKEDRTLTESKVMTQKAKEIVNKYREKTYALIDNVPKDIASLNLSENTRREMLSGFNKGMEKSKRQIDEMWGLEGRIISEFENIFALLSAKKRAWVVSNGQILFNNNNDLNRFNSHSASIENMAQQQEAIRKQSIETSNELFNKLKQ